MKKQLLLSLCIVFSTGAFAQSSDTVNFNTWVSPINDDLANYFPTGGYSMIQHTTNGITGGSVTPSASATQYNNAIYLKKYYLVPADPAPTTLSICFKYQAVAALDGKTGAIVGLTLENDSTTVFDWVTASIKYNDFNVGTNIYIIGVGQNFSSSQFSLTDGNWYRLTLTVKAINADSVNASAYVYNLGAAGTSTPSLAYSYVDQVVSIAGLTMHRSYMNASFNGGTDGGITYLDNFNITGYTTPPSGVKEIELQNSIAMPTLVSGSLPVTTNLTGSVQYSIYNLEGKTILKGSFSKTGNIDVSTLAPQSYLIKMIYDGRSLTRKFVKQ